MILLVLINSYKSQNYPLDAQESYCCYTGYRLDYTIIYIKQTLWFTASIS